jgi:arylsulfatase
MRVSLFGFVLLGVLSCGVSGFGASRPNIIVILSDDVGYSDVGCFGGEIQTPTLDSLAGGGVRFTQFYNTARCCPTRAALLTGLYAHQAGIGHMVDDWSAKVGEAYAGDLSKRAVTIAEALKAAGYANYMVGKWHVTKMAMAKDEAGKYNWPLQRGFDRFYGTIHGAGSFYDPNTLVRDNAFVSPYADEAYQPAEYYYTDAINDHAARFVTEHARSKADFCMWRIPQRIGRCMRRRRTSRSTKGSMTGAMRGFAASGWRR